MHIVSNRAARRELRFDSIRCDMNGTDMAVFCVRNHVKHLVPSCAAFCVARERARAAAVVWLSETGFDGANVSLI